MNNCRTVLLAGSTGTIGRTVLANLLKSDYEVICPVRSISQAKKNKINNKENVTIVVMDICDSGFVKEFCENYERVNVIISCIGSRNGTLKESREVEFEANMNLLEVGEKLQAEQYILLSAICVQKPKLLFQKYKLKFEKALKESKINHTIIRPTAYFKSLSGQIERVKSGKRFIIFDQGLTNWFKPISERDLSLFITKKILKKTAYGKVFLIGGPGPAINPREQGKLLFKAANMSERFLSLPSYSFKILLFTLGPFGIFSQKIRDLKEFLRIALYYATESMLVWDEEDRNYTDKKTPEFGNDTLEGFYEKVLKPSTKGVELPDRKLFG